MEELSETVKSGLQNGSLAFKKATKMIVEMGDVSVLLSCSSSMVYIVEPPIMDDPRSGQPL